MKKYTVYLYRIDKVLIGYLNTADVEHIGIDELVAEEELLKTGNVTDHFKYREFLCNCKGKYCSGHSSLSVRTFKANVATLAKALEEIRKEAGNKPIVVRSGIRCKRQNESVDGATASTHLTALGGDLSISGLTQAQVYGFVKTVMTKRGKGGIGYGGSHYTHVDVRDSKLTIWTY